MYRGGFMSDFPGIFVGLLCGFLYVTKILCFLNGGCPLGVLLCPFLCSCGSLLLGVLRSLLLRALFLGAQLLGEKIGVFLHCTDSFEQFTKTVHKSADQPRGEDGCNGSYCADNDATD